jgi:hypothetical protein
MSSRATSENAAGFRPMWCTSCFTVSSTSNGAETAHNGNKREAMNAETKVMDVTLPQQKSPVKSVILRPK